MKRSVTVTLWANRLVALLLGVLLPTMPLILKWYSQVRTLENIEKTAILIAFYCCAVVVGIALWNMDKLLRAIRKSDVFVFANVRSLRAVQWCCGGVCLICIPAAFCYYPLGLMVVVMAFLFLTVSVVCRVMEAAVQIREENDLTV